MCKPQGLLELSADHVQGEQFSMDLRQRVARGAGPLAVVDLLGDAERRLDLGECTRVLTARPEDIRAKASEARQPNT
jgi:hypothetical protein